MSFPFFRAKIPESVTWEKVRGEILSIFAEEDRLAVIKPFNYEDMLTKHKIEIRTSPRYSILSIDDREYYFDKESGEFDGTSISMKD